MSTDAWRAERSRAWIDVQPDALCRNLRRIRESVGAEAALIPMVKADGYGLGMDAVVGALEPEDPWGFGVATVEEGARIRALGIEKPVVIFSPIPPAAYDRAVASDLTVTVSDLDGVDCLGAAAGRQGRAARFHVEVDTGMGRSGFDWRRAHEWGPAVAERTTSALTWEGCYTHFHSADLDGDEATPRQWQRFQDVLEGLPEGTGRLVHACNGAAALRYPAMARDGVRPGIFLYGGSAGAGLAEPEPVAALRARVTLVRDVSEGTTVGYGATHRATGSARWATLGIGYGDGLPRALGNRGSALVSGQRVPIIGRISMDMTVVDITGVEGVVAGAVATLIGTDGGERITLDEVADLAGTISYEILTGLTRRLPRIWSVTDDV